MGIGLAAERQGAQSLQLLSASSRQALETGPPTGAITDGAVRVAVGTLA